MQTTVIIRYFKFRSRSFVGTNRCCLPLGIVYSFAMDPHASKHRHPAREATEELDSLLQDVTQICFAPFSAIDHSGLCQGFARVVATEAATNFETFPSLEAARVILQDAQNSDFADELADSLAMTCFEIKTSDPLRTTLIKILNTSINHLMTSDTHATDEDGFSRASQGFYRVMLVLRAFALPRLSISFVSHPAEQHSRRALLWRTRTAYRRWRESSHAFSGCGTGTITH